MVAESWEERLPTDAVRVADPVLVTQVSCPAADTGVEGSTAVLLDTHAATARDDVAPAGMKELSSEKRR